MRSASSRARRGCSSSCFPSSALVLFNGEMKPADPGSDPTLLQTAVDSLPSSPADRPSMPDGYDLGALLGHGGMGEVLAANDRKIRREVAIKRMRGGLGSGAEARFLREAHIQARLDHPA